MRTYSKPLPSLEHKELDILAYLELVKEGFARAEEAVGGTIDKYYKIGNHSICLRFAGEALIPYITPAIAHLACSPTTKPDLTIHLWDIVSTNSKLPLLLSSLVCLLGHAWWVLADNRGALKDYSSKRLKTVFYPHPNRLSLLDLEENKAFYWLENALQVPYYEMGASLKVILHLWFQEREYHYIHAGAVGLPTGGVIIPGKGGSGKSTTTLTCLDSELMYASDDYSLITLQPEPYVYSLYNTAKLNVTETDFKRFPHLVPLIHNTDSLEEEKAMLFVQQHYPEKVSSGFPLKAIFVPRVTGELNTEIKPSTPGQALAAIAPSSILQLPGETGKAFKMMSQLVRQVKCYSLELGTDLSQISPTILNFLQLDD